MTRPGSLRLTPFGDGLEKTVRSARGALKTLAYKARTRREQTSMVGVAFDGETWMYKRYLYTFLKYLQMEGYGIGLQVPFRGVDILSGRTYERLIFSERLVSLSRPPPSVTVIGPKGDIGLEPVNFMERRDPTEYVVPMAQHPLSYSRGLWNRPLDPGKPLCAVFFAGNIGSNLYENSAIEADFEVISRGRLIGLIEQAMPIQRLDGQPASKAKAGTIVLHGPTIPVEAFRPTLARFAFFLCAPGVWMPLCHNLVEAMSAGAIPILQKPYAELFETPLEHGETAIVFEDEHDLAARIHEALAMSDAARAALRSRVLAFYDAHFTPRAVVSRMFATDVRTIRLLAGEHSVELLRQSRTKSKRTIGSEKGSRQPP